MVIKQNTGTAAPLGQMSSDGFKERISMEICVLKHLNTMSDMIVSKGCTLEQYNVAVSHLDGMLNPVKDDRFGAELKKLEEWKNKKSAFWFRVLKYDEDWSMKEKANANITHFGNLF